MWLPIFLIISLGFVGCSTSKDDVDESAEFEKILEQEANGNNAMLLVLFSKKCCTCTDCVEAEVRLGGMSQNLEKMNILVVRLRKSSHRKRYGIKTLPSVVFIRKGVPALYDGKLEVERLFWWLTDNSEPVTKELDDDSFEHLTQAATGSTTGDWLVAFYDPSCIDKNALYTHLECVATHARNYLNVALVDVSKATETKSRLAIKQCPEVILFKKGKMYRTSWSNAATLRLFYEKLHQEHKAESVPVPLSGFDKLIDGCVSLLKQHTQIVLGAAVLVLVGGILYSVIATRKQPKPKSN